jgi:cytochrome c oxidase assembly factor CtaG
VFALVPLHVEQASTVPLTWTSWLTTWAWEPLPLAGILLVATLYLAGVSRLRRRGDRWPPGRTVAFIAGGLGTIVFATQSFLAFYDSTLLSVHMAQHMLLSMVAPILLGLGAPITLVLRTTGPGVRRVLMAVLHSRWMRIVGHPVVAGALFIVNPWVLYFSPLYELTLRNELVHNLNHLHFLALGCLWFWSLVGIDPMPRADHLMRVLAVFVSLPFHAFLGVVLM